MRTFWQRLYVIATLAVATPATAGAVDRQPVRATHSTRGRSPHAHRAASPTSTPSTRVLPASGQFLHDASAQLQAAQIALRMAGDAAHELAEISETRPNISGSDPTIRTRIMVRQLTAAARNTIERLDDAAPLLTAAEISGDEMARLASVRDTAREIQLQSARLDAIVEHGETDPARWQHELPALTLRLRTTADALLDLLRGLP